MKNFALNERSQLRGSVKISFELLNESHFALIYRWFNEPHVQAFYSLRSWTFEEVCKKLTPYVQSEKQMRSFIIYLGKDPMGYIQSYPIKDHPWECQDLSNEIIQEAAGFDLFIGEKEHLGKGLGCQIIDCFLEEHIWSYYRYCLADPDIQNTASMRLFQKCGFIKHKKIASKDALKRNVTLQLFIKERE